ncbi:MAG: SBBP repeat-containing protein, partial [Limisphaerales bacterium]
MNFRAKKIPFSAIAGFAFCFAALTVSAQTATTFGNLPLYFEANSPAEFLARGSDAQFLISPDEAQLSLRKADSIRSVQMQFVGANSRAQISGEAKLAGEINDITGNDPSQWRSGIPIFSKVRVSEIYPGVGLVYYGNQKQLEYDFTVAAGANPNSIAIHFTGADAISVNARGQLVLKLGGDEILQPKPLIYQTIGGAQKQIRGGYKMLDAQTVAFSVGNYDHSQPLVIDPILSYSTYFGGTLGETAWAVAINPNDGSVYIAGQTFSKLFMNGAPFSTTGAFQTNFQGGKLTGDAFVARFDNLGTNLQYLTYLGGNADDAAYSLAVDGAGDAYVAGFTDSSNFPTVNAIYPNIGGTYSKSFGSFHDDAFVAKLSPGGSNLIYSTYLGGSSKDVAEGIAVDASGNAFVTGFTYSSNFPTANAVQNHLACTNSFYFNANAFVSEIASNGSALIFSTYLGGTNFDEANSVAVDTNGFIYAAGFTSSTNFPATNSIPRFSLLNGSTNKLNTAYDAFVTKFYPSGANLV